MATNQTDVKTLTEAYPDIPANSNQVPIQFYWRDDTKQMLQQDAAQSGVNLSVFLREVIGFYYAAKGIQLPDNKKK